MQNIEEAITAIDNKLLESGKEYLVLQQASKLLVSLNFIEDTSELKTALINGAFPHAYKTDESPKQWRIPLSEGGLSRKKKVKKTSKRTTTPDFIKQDTLKDVLCPSCKNYIPFPQNLAGVNIPCPYCGTTIYTLNDDAEGITISNAINNISGKRIAQIILILFVAIMYFAYSESGCSNSNKGELKEYEARGAVITYVKDYLRNPDSYKSVSWSPLRKDERNSTYYITHTYRATNGFGGVVTETKIFHINSNGDVIDYY